MKLVRKIKFKRAKELSLFKKIESSFIKGVDLDCKNPNSIKSVSDISKLHFFLILEYINLIDDKIDYNKIFPSSPLGENHLIDFNNLIEEQEKLKSHIQKSQKRGPSYFKNIGILNEVIGCYLLATPFKHLKKIKNLDLKNKIQDSFIVAKFDFKKLPNEFEKICLSYGKNKSSFLEKEKKEFQDFLNLTNEEQDSIIDEMLDSIQSPFIDFEIPDTTSSSATTIQFAAENSINQIYNIDFLTLMLSSAEESENYELCIKIRDRIWLLQNKK